MVNILGVASCTLVGLSEFLPQEVSLLKDNATSASDLDNII